MKLVLSIVAASLLAGAAEAQSWTTVVSADGISFEYDTASVQRSGSNVTIQTRAVYSSPQPVQGSNGAVIGQATESLETMNFDCAAHTYVDESRTVKSADGTVLLSQGPQASEAIAAGSSAAAYAAAVCH